MFCCCCGFLQFLCVFELSICSGGVNFVCHLSCQKVFVNLFDVEKKEHVWSRQTYWLNKFSQFYIFLAKSKIPFWVEYQLLIDIYRTGSSAIDFTQLGHRKSFGTKYKTDISNSLSFFYLVPKHFRCPNWVKSIADDPTLTFWSSFL